METVKGPDSLEKELERMVGLYQLSLLRLCYAYLHDEDLAKDADKTGDGSLCLQKSKECLIMKRKKQNAENSKSSWRQRDLSCDASGDQPAKDIRRR